MTGAIKRFDYFDYKKHGQDRDDVIVIDRQLPDDTHIVARVYDKHLAQKFVDYLNMSAQCPSF